jgi:peroxiredoxin
VRHTNPPTKKKQKKKDPPPYASKKERQSSPFHQKKENKQMFSVASSGGVTRITGLRLRGREEGDDVGRRRGQQQQQTMMSLRRSLMMRRRPNKSPSCHHQRCCSSLCCCCCGADGGKTTSPDEKKRPTKGRRPFLSSPPHLTTTKTTKTSSRHVFDVSTKAVAYPNEREDKQQQHEHEHHQQLIKKGDRIPTSSLQYFDHEGNLQSIETSQLCSKGKTIVVFAVPGAFLPTCTNKHLPGFIDLAAKMKQAGCDLIACVSVNDAFVMDAWGKAVGAAPVLMCGDGSGDFTRKLGCELDLMDKGLGVRSRRYAMIVKDGIVEYIEMERGGAFTRSRAEDVLQVLEEIKS